MRNLALRCAAVVAALLVPLPAMPAPAPLVTFVAGNGAISNDCLSPATACRLPSALSLTRPGGHVICVSGGLLDSVTITQSVTIDCSGVVGATIGEITVAGPAGAAPIVVKLRGLTVSGMGLSYLDGADFGIKATNVGALFVEKCEVSGFTSRITGTNGTPGVGLLFSPPDGVTAKLHVADSVFINNGLSDRGGGIVIQPSGSGSARVVIERSRVEKNTYGVFANGMGSTGVIAVQIKDSDVARNDFNGISAFTKAGNSVISITVDGSSSLHNLVGILAQGSPAFLILAHSTVIGNGTGLQSLDGGSIFSYQDNQLTGNLANGAVTAVLARQ